MRRKTGQDFTQYKRNTIFGVTRFFRDGAVWEQLAKDAIPAILLHKSNRQLRAWVPACSTGEEAYSLAIVFKEAINRLQPGANYLLQIVATDIDRDAIDKVRRGLCPLRIAEEVSPERLQRFFFTEDNAYRINKEIREMVIFAPQNVIMDPPFTKLDLLSCRNLLIYLAPELQKKLLPHCIDVATP